MAWRVVILGGGFGGLYAARKLEKLLPAGSARVTLINDVNFVLYTPLLPGAAGGTLEPRHVVVPLREQLKRTHLKLARVTSADPSRREVTISSPDGNS
jgi:NADH:ubiquinone reductase (H+-translocating)